LNFLLFYIPSFYMLEVYILCVLYASFFMNTQSFAPVKLTASRAINVNRYTSDDSLERKKNELVPPYRGLLGRIAINLFGKLSRVLWCLEFKGVENLPTEGTFILCPNHESHFDIFWIAMGLPQAIRDRLCCFAKQELFEHPFHRAFAKVACAIPVDRDGYARPALRAGVQTLKSARPLLIHPEGTRTRTGEILPFMRGPAKLALSTGAPLIPVRIIGAYKIYPSHRLFPRIFDWKQLQRLKLSIVFGAPIYPSRGQSHNKGAAFGQGEVTTAHQLTEQLQEVVASLAV
jgi:1-acyl-sn-glycerol-3-phosphate acyltransferase